MSKPMPEKKDPPFRLVRFVQVPRALVPHYGDLPWEEVVEAAIVGKDDLKIVNANYFSLAQPTPDTAYLREYRETGGCLLFQQNWCDESNDGWRPNVVKWLR